MEGNNYVLLERQERTFIPTKENKRTLEFNGSQVMIKRMAYRDTSPIRGTKYGGFLITITDERGKVIQHKTSNEFLFDNLDRLKKLAPNNYFNKECIRVTPTQPTEDTRGPGAIDFNPSA